MIQVSEPANKSEFVCNQHLCGFMLIILKLLFDSNHATMNVVISPWTTGCKCRISFASMFGLRGWRDVKVRISSISMFSLREWRDFNVEYHLSVCDHHHGGLFLRRINGLVVCRIKPLAYFILFIYNIRRGYGAIQNRFNSRLRSL